MVLRLVALMRRRSAATAGTDLEPPRPTATLARRFWRFTAPRSVASIFRVGVQWIDVLIVGAVMSPADAAVYVTWHVDQMVAFQTAETMFDSFRTEGALAAQVERRFSSLPARSECDRRSLPGARRCDRGHARRYVPGCP